MNDELPHTQDYIQVAEAMTKMIEELKGVKPSIVISGLISLAVQIGIYAKPDDLSVEDLELGMLDHTKLVFSVHKTLKERQDLNDMRLN